MVPREVKLHVLTSYTAPNEKVLIRVVDEYLQVYSSQENRIYIACRPKLFGAQPSACAAAVVRAYVSLVWYGMLWWRAWMELGFGAS